jgi:prepilin-type N-terminal cleavage/methylation domain-containing protein
MKTLIVKSLLTSLFLRLGESARVRKREEKILSIKGELWDAFPSLVKRGKGRFSHNDDFLMLNNKGVTLVEVMIALVIFLIVFMGLMQTALLSIDGNVRNVQRDEAITLANGELDNLRNTPFDSLNADATWHCNTSSKDFRNISKQFNICERVTNLDAAPNTRSIDVVIGWDHKNETAAQSPTNKEFQHSISTVRRRS